MVAQAAVGAFTSSKAAGAQKSAGDAAIAEQNKMYDTTRGDLMPYQQLGQGAINPLMGLLGINGSGIDPQTIQNTLQNMPGYQFTLNQGLKSVQNSAAARGLGSSGAALKGAADFSTGLAQSQYGNYYNQLMGAAGLGENAAAMTGQIGQGYGNNINSDLLGQGNAEAAMWNNIGNNIQNQMSTTNAYAMNFLNSGSSGGGGGGGGGGGMLAGIMGMFS